MTENRPPTVRQVFYRLIALGVIDKTHRAYRAVATALRPS